MGIRGWVEKSKAKGAPPPWTPRWGRGPQTPRVKGFQRGVRLCTFKLPERTPL
jgi:hypothetical protein